jgi:hypothetical protein
MAKKKMSKKDKSKDLSYFPYKMQKKERKEFIIRLLVFFVGGFVLWIWAYLVMILTAINFLIVLFAGKRNKDIAGFSEYWTTEVYRYIQYVTFAKDEKPFPFSELKYKPKK